MEVTTATRQIRLTQHAIERYRERVKPALGIGTCKRELHALAVDAPLLHDLPFERYGDEIAESERLPDPDGYLELAPKIFGIVVIDGQGVHGILTILVDGHLSPPRRRARNEAKATRRRSRRRERSRRYFVAGMNKGRPKIEWK